MLWRIEQAADRRELHEPSGLHDCDAICDARGNTQIVRNQNDRHGTRALELGEQRQDLRLNGDIERGRRLIGDEQDGITRQRNREHDPLAHASGKLMRVLASAPPGVGHVQIVEQTRCKRARFARARSTVGDDGLGDLICDAQVWCERAHRILKDHSDARATHLIQKTAARAKKLQLTEAHAARSLGRLRREIHHGKHGLALARA